MPNNLTMRKWSWRSRWGLRGHDKKLRFHPKVMGMYWKTLNRRGWWKLYFGFFFFFFSFHTWYFTCFNAILPNLPTKRFNYGSYVENGGKGSRIVNGRRIKKQWLWSRQEMMVTWIRVTKDGCSIYYRHTTGSTWGGVWNLNGKEKELLRMIPGFPAWTKEMETLAGKFVGNIQRFI